MIASPVVRKVRGIGNVVLPSVTLGLMLPSACDPADAPAPDHAVFLRRPVVPLAVALIAGIAVHDRLPVHLFLWIGASLAFNLYTKTTRTLYPRGTR